MIAGCLLALVAAAAPFDVSQLEVPGGFARIEVPDTLKALGIPVRLRAVRTKEKPQALILYFQRAFEKAGLFVAQQGELRNPGNLVQVTALDVDTRTSYSVLLQPNLDGTTTVVIGEAYLHAAQQKEAPAPFAPVFPGSTGLVIADLEVGQSLSYGARATAAEITAFYRETLGSAGYAEVGELQFEKKSSRLRIWLKPRGNDETGVVVIRSSSR